MTNHYVMLNRIIVCFLFLLMLSCKTDPHQAIQSNDITGDTDIDAVTKAISKNTGDASLYYERAKLFYDRKNYDRAIEDLASSMKIDSISAISHHLLADVYLDYFQSRKALATMLRAAKLHPSRIPTLLKLCEVQYILKQYDESRKTVNNILKLDRENAEAYLMLGLNFKDEEDFVRAVNSFQTAVELDPELVDAWILLGDLYANNDAESAISFYDNALTVDPQSIAALHSKAFYLQNKDRLTEAITEYNKIKMIDKSYKDAYLNSGILYMEMDSVDRAFEEFNIMVGVAPDSHLAYYYRGLASASLGKVEEAKNDFNSSLNLKRGFQKAQEALERLQ